MKFLRQNKPAWMGKPKAKLAFDTLMFVGSCVVMVKCGEALHQTLDACVPSEKEILAQMKAE